MSLNIEKNFAHNLASKYIEFTYLNPFSSEKDIEIDFLQPLSRFRTETELSPRKICVAPKHIKVAADSFSFETDLVTVIGFPFSMATTSAKVKEIEEFKMDVKEFDIVMDVGSLRSGKLKQVQEDLRECILASDNKTTKVIIETPVLTNEEIIKATTIAEACGANFIKTATGFSGPARVNDIKLIKKTLSNENIGIKASSGIKTFLDCCAFIEAGATRIGTSKGIEIVREALRAIPTSAIDN